MKPDAFQWQTTDFSARDNVVVRGDVDAATYFHDSAVSLFARVKQEELSVLKYADAGVNLYGNAILASSNLVAQNPKVVEAFLRATNRAILETLANPGPSIAAVRQMILADDSAGRRTALAKLLPEQRADFHAIFEVMAGLPVTIRLLDPPLHEFLPQGEEEFAELSETIGVGIDHLKRRAAELHEFNPMLGHRGCRLGITFPEIYEMQARAIFEAACDVAALGGEAPVPEVMVPLVATKRELEILKALIDRTAQEVFAEKGRTLQYHVGTMIELPRAALMAGEIAEVGEFFSFGTNDLTQTTLGVSRDDAAKFLVPYVEQGIFARDPFVSLDIEGVGQLVEMASERGRKTRPDIKLGICGEHGGDPASIAFCEQVGLDYVSASPFRVPIARLAAAQAALGK